MTPEETATVLAKCAAVDRRTVGRSDVLAWYEIIGHLDLSVGLEAVRRWYTDHREWIMPADVVQLGSDIIRERRRTERERQEAQQLALEQADPTRRDRSDDVRELIAQLRTMLPDGDPDKLRWGHKHWRQVREARERRERAEPNPHYDPSALARLADAAAKQAPPQRRKTNDRNRIGQVDAGRLPRHQRAGNTQPHRRRAQTHHTR